MILRTLSVSHADPHTAGHLVQEAVANAQLDGWTVESVSSERTETTYTYEVATSRLAAFVPALAA